MRTGTPPRGGGADGKAGRPSLTDMLRQDAVCRNAPRSVPDRPRPRSVLRRGCGDDARRRAPAFHKTDHHDEFAVAIDELCCPVEWIHEEHTVCGAVLREASRIAFFCDDRDAWKTLGESAANELVRSEICRRDRIGRAP